MKFKFYCDVFINIKNCIYFFIIIRQTKNYDLYSFDCTFNKKIYIATFRNAMIDMIQQSTLYNRIKTILYYQPNLILNNSHQQVQTIEIIKGAIIFEYNPVCVFLAGQAGLTKIKAKIHLSNIVRMPSRKRFHAKFSRIFMRLENVQIFQYF